MDVPILPVPRQMRNNNGEPNKHYDHENTAAEKAHYALCVADHSPSQLHNNT